jgi:hypothetical protein
LAARLYSDPPDIVVAFKQENFGPLSERFIAAIQRVLPDRDPVELALSFQYIVGMMVHVIAGQLELSEEPARDEDARPDDQGLLASLIRFAAAGLRSSPTSAPRKTE